MASTKGRVQIKMPSMPRMPSICPVDIFVPRSLGIFILNTRHFYTYKYDQYYEHISTYVKLPSEEKCMFYTEHRHQKI